MLNADCFATWDALQILAEFRPRGSIVVTNQTSARLWPLISDGDLDFHYNPSNMGGAVPLGLGLAVAQPEREVIVVSGDGSLLMNLGCLVSVVDSGAANLTVIVLENGVYEVTGRQATPAANGRVDFAGIARSCGFVNSLRVQSASSWRQTASQLFQQKGPRFFALAVMPVDQMPNSTSTTNIKDQCRRLRERCLSARA